MYKKLTAEFLGSLFLASSVVGSGIMATTLTQDIAIQLFINTITTVFMLFVIITLFSSISGAMSWRHTRSTTSSVTDYRKEGRRCLRLNQLFYLCVSTMLGVRKWQRDL